MEAKLQGEGWLGGKWHRHSARQTKSQTQQIHNEQSGGTHSRTHTHT